MTGGGRRAWPYLVGGALGIGLAELIDNPWLGAAVLVVLIAALAYVRRRRSAG